MLHLEDFILPWQTTEKVGYTMPVHIFITIKTAVTKQQLLHLYTCFNRSNKPTSDLTEDKRLHRQNQVNVTEERAEAQCNQWERSSRASPPSPSQSCTYICQLHVSMQVSSWAPLSVWHRKLAEDCSESLKLLTSNTFISCQQLLNQCCFLQLYN